MMERRVTGEQARQGHTGKGVRYVLGLSLLGAAIALIVVALAV